MAAPVKQVSRITKNEFLSRQLSEQNCARRMYSTLDFSLMKAAGAFSLPPSYRTVKPARLLPHCVCQQKGHCSLMPASWKWVTAPCHVADLYPDGALCSGTKEHGSPRSLTFSAAIMTGVLIKSREKSKCAQSKMWGYWTAGLALWILGSSTSCRVWCLFYMPQSIL